jgi:hypothetical protein
MVVMWDGDAPTYLEIMRRAHPIVRRVLEDPELKI